MSTYKVVYSANESLLILDCDVTFIFDKLSREMIIITSREQISSSIENISDVVYRQSSSYILFKNQTTLHALNFHYDSPSFIFRSGNTTYNRTAHNMDITLQHKTLIAFISLFADWFRVCFSSDYGKLKKNWKGEIVLDTGEKILDTLFIDSGYKSVIHKAQGVLFPEMSIFTFERIRDCHFVYPDLDFTLKVHLVENLFPYIVLGIKWQNLANLL